MTVLMMFFNNGSELLSHEVIAEGVDICFSSWNEGQNSNVSLEELYAAADKVQDAPAKMKERFFAMLESAKNAATGEFYVDDWSTASHLIELGAKQNPPFTREEVIGCIVCIVAPKPPQGSVDYCGTVRKLKEFWGEKVTVDEMHKAFMCPLSTPPSLIQPYLEPVMVLMRDCQNELTQRATMDLIQKYPNIQTIIAVCGRRHVTSLVEGLSEN